jgi:hypothetical protein
MVGFVRFKDAFAVTLIDQPDIACIIWHFASGEIRFHLFGRHLHKFIGDGTADDVHAA